MLRGFSVVEQKQTEDSKRNLLIFSPIFGCKKDSAVLFKRCVTHDARRGSETLSVRMTARRADMQLHRNSMRRSKIHANWVFGLLIYLEQTAPLWYEVFNKDCLLVKPQSPTFTFRHRLFHMVTYNKATLWEHREETDAFIQLCSVIWSWNSAPFWIRLEML